MLGGLVAQLGDRDMLRQLAALGWWAPLLVVPYGLFCTLDVKGWQCVLPPGMRPSLARLYAIRLAGEAVNDFTPTASVGGEGLKAYLLRRVGVPANDAVVSVIVARTALTAAQILFILAGFAVFVVRSRLGVRGGLTLVALCIASYLFVFALVRWQRRGLLSGVVFQVQRFVGRHRVGERWTARGRAVDGAMAQFYSERGGDFAWSIAWHFASWALGAAELMVLSWLLGQPLGWLDAVVIEALNQPVKAASLIVPGAIGVQEAGGVLAFTLVGLDPRLGLSVMLLRRVREVCYGALGLLILRSLSRSPAARA